MFEKRIEIDESTFETGQKVPLMVVNVVVVVDNPRDKSTLGIKARIA